MKTKWIKCIETSRNFKFEFLIDVKWTRSNCTIWGIALTKRYWDCLTKRTSSTSWRWRISSWRKSFNLARGIWLWLRGSWRRCWWKWFKRGTVAINRTVTSWKSELEIAATRFNRTGTRWKSTITIESFTVATRVVKFTTITNSFSRTNGGGVEFSKAAIKNRIRS